MDESQRSAEQLKEWKNPLRVWWVPQVPMVAFRVDVKTPWEGILLCNTLAAYDLFQYEKKVKPDYSNAGGIEELTDEGWMDAWHPDDDDFFGGWGE